MTSDSVATNDSAARFTIERFDDASPAQPAKWFGAGHEHGSVYVVRDDGEVLWTVGIDFGDVSHVPFREELFWEATNTVVIGGGNVVYVFDVLNGVVRAKVPVPSFFAHLAIATIATAGGVAEEFLFILGWADVHAIDSQLETRWTARDVAVDGVVFREICDNVIVVSAEMDPPGGWVDVALDALTGAELWRET